MAKITAEDLSKALKRSEQAASDAGVVFNDLIKLIALSYEKEERSGEVIGNAFKTIFTRLKKDEVLKKLPEFGVILTHKDGSKKSTYSILESIIYVYNYTEDHKKCLLAALIGGTYQMKITESIFDRTI